MSTIITATVGKDERGEWDITLREAYGATDAQLADAYARLVVAAAFALEQVGGAGRVGVAEKVTWAIVETKAEGRQS